MNTNPELLAIDLVSVQEDRTTIYAIDQDHQLWILNGTPYGDDILYSPDGESMDVTGNNLRIPQGIYDFVWEILRRVGGEGE